MHLSTFVKAVVVAKEEGQHAVKRLKENGALRGDRKIVKSNGHLVIPVFQKGALEAGFSISDVEDTPLRNEFCVPVDMIRSQCPIPEHLKHQLPGRWEMLGDLVVVDFPEELDPFIKSIAPVYADILKVSSVIRVKGVIDGEYRIPKTELVYGEKTETIHLENGISYAMDPTRVMFSSGNIDERIRMANLDAGGETVVDMFAGIGYFTLPLAKHAGARVLAYEKNPTAYGYLERNIALNGLESRVKSFLGDNRNAQEGVADRVVMGYMGGTGAFLEKALTLLRTGGVVHYHDGFFEDELWEVPLRFIEKAVKKIGGTYEIIEKRRVKSYAPRRYHVVLDFYCEKNA